ncbi:hypothetical protein HK098_002564 [Nowakowskiella sp. JEL0407]|nr:hypothetical protein HK098_002564 [Nowakowskiella sp. JEL0407]
MILWRRFLSLIAYDLIKHRSRCVQNETILHYACGETNLVLVLLAFGADPRQKNSKGKSSFSLACEYGHELVLKLILKGVSQSTIMKLITRTNYKFRKANVKPILPGIDTSTNAHKISKVVNSKDKLGNTPLMNIVNDDRNFGIVWYLIGTNSKVNVQNKEGNSALDIAIHGTPNLYIKNNKGKMACDLVDLWDGHQIAKALRGEEVDWVRLMKYGKCLKQIVERGFGF